MVTELRRITVDYQVSVTRCESVYAAVAEVVRNRGRPVLVVGALSDLAIEKGGFFAVAGRNRASCCVVMEGGSVDGGDLLAAVRGGAAVVDRTEDVRLVLERWLSGLGCHWENAAVADEECRATEAELKALLGHEAND
jgi:hypothetical protein